MPAPMAPPVSNGFLPDVPTMPIMRLSVEQHDRMLEAGILWSGDPVELLEGWLVVKTSKNPPHVYATAHFATCFRMPSRPGGS